MEKKLSYTFKLSLTEIALRRVAVNLWYSADVLASISKIQIHSLVFSRSSEALNIVESKVLELELPEALKKQLMVVVKPIGLQIKGWKDYHGDYLDYKVKEFDASILQKLCWTTLGTIDYKKTSDVLVYNKMLSILDSFKLACLYCLEDYIAALWKELPEHNKNVFYMNENDRSIPKVFFYFCWPYIPEGRGFEVYRTISVNPTEFYQYIFENSAIKGNKVAVAYFFPKLTPEEAELTRIAVRVMRRRSALSERRSSCIPKEKFSEVLYYLLSLMTLEQQVEVMKTYPSEFLSCFLDWPLQDLFLEVSDFMWIFLKEFEYDILLVDGFDRFDVSNYFFPKLFQGVFTRFDMNCRKRFVKSVKGWDFCKFDMTQDLETIIFIFRNVDAEGRMELVSSFRTLFESLISEGKWHLVEVCLREARLSKEDKINFRVDFTKSLSKRKMKQPKWRKFFQILDRIFSRTPDKVNSEIKILAKAKRHGLKK